jgi:hypothetical protein
VCNLFEAVANNENFLESEVSGRPFVEWRCVQWGETVGENNGGGIDIHHINNIVRLMQRITESEKRLMETNLSISRQ